MNEEVLKALKVLTNKINELHRAIVEKKNGRCATMTFKEAMMYTGFSKCRLRMYMETNKVTFIQKEKGHNVFFLQKDLDDLLTSECNLSTRDIERKVLEHMEMLRQKKDGKKKGER